MADSNNEKIPGRAYDIGVLFILRSLYLYRKLENNVKCELVLSVGGGHCFEKVYDTIEANVTAEDMWRKTFDFIVKHKFYSNDN